MYVNKCTKCGSEFETKNPKRVICPDCLYPDKKMAVSSDSSEEKPANTEGGSFVPQENAQPQSGEQQPQQQNFYSSYSQDAPQQRPYNNDRGYQGGGGYNRPQQGGYNRPQGGGYQGGGYNRPQQGGYQQRDGGYNRPQQGGYNRPQQGGYQQRDGGYNRPQQGGYNRPQQGGYNRPQGGYQQREGGYNRPQGGYQQREGGYNRPQQGGYNRPQGGGGGYNRPQGGFNRPQGGGNRFGGARPPMNRNKTLLVSKEQLEQIELLYKAMLPLPNPDAHEVIGAKIELEPRKVFFGINLIRQKMMLPKLPFPKRKLAISPDQMFAIQNLYEPLLPLPPIGCHKIIAAQLKMDEWRVHVGIGLIRAKMGLDRWNQERADAPEEFKKQAEAEAKKAKKEKAPKEKAEKPEKAAKEKKEKAEKPKAKSKKTAKEE